VAHKDAILAVLGPGGLLEKTRAGYEHRPQQIAMAQQVRRSLDLKRCALIEAGTGTGKTLAYLLPAALSGLRVVVSTATKTLQEQILDKDLPLLREASGIDFTAALMKGRANYLCLDKLEQAPHGLAPSAMGRTEAKVLDGIRAWAEETETGDRAELDLPERLPLWKELSATSDSCSGQGCPHWEACFVTRMRKRAADADLIIVNHHLFFADLSLRTAPGNGRGVEIIPRYEAVVFDEAHALEDVATEHFGLSASDYRVEDLLSDAQRVLEAEGVREHGVAALLDKVERFSDGFFNQVGKLLSPSESGQRLTRAKAAPLGSRAAELVDALKAFGARLGRADAADVASLARRAGEIADDVKFLVEAREPGFVFWVESRARATFLRAAPIDVAKELQARLFPNVPALVFTSATLAAQGRLDFAKKRLGLADAETGEDCYAVDTLVLDSPFDYQAQAALYAPASLPDPTDPEFVARASDEILDLCAITGGRAFVLFTSLRNMQEAHRRLADRLPYRVLLQGERPKASLIAEFKERPSVLFASQSFWEGVDVAGEALSLVIIDKLPFASPADPIVAARIEQLKERGREPFGEYQVPQAALALRQGFGRLIRTRRDRGIVAVLDRRLTTKAYGRAFLESLPRCPRTGDRAAVERWWKRAG
jgi:ATP-dependent DNA helicase DinG